MFIGVSFLKLFIQQNWTGPPLSLCMTSILPEALRDKDEVL